MKETLQYSYKYRSNTFPSIFSFFLQLKSKMYWMTYYGCVTVRVIKSRKYQVVFKKKKTQDDQVPNNMPRMRQKQSLFLFFLSSRSSQSHFQQMACLKFLSYLLGATR